MGVTGLLQHLKEIQEKSSLEKYRGKTLAIDTYGWLHRGLISCAQELCKDQPTRKYITSILKKVDMLRHFGVEPYFVFDGAALPTKAETARERREKREEARLKAEEFSRKGDKKSAWKEYMKAACVTSEMAKSIMVELDQRKIKYVVAPYEADPQMVYLEKVGLVDGILSEDSDLLIFGCRRLITKLKDDATCIEICRDNFGKVKKIPHLSNFTQGQLRLVAMLSGCDYTKGVPNIGLKTAFTLVQKYNNLEKILLALRADGKSPPDDFMSEVHLADLAFQFQKVFNPIENKLMTLNDYPLEKNLDFETLESCCGRTFDDNLYFKLCNGHIHPSTHEILVSREQNLVNLKSNSVNLGSLRSKSKSISNNYTLVHSTKKKHGSIDNFFSRKTERNSDTHSEGIKRSSSQSVVSKSQISPTSKKIKKMMSEDSRSITGPIEFNKAEELVQVDKDNSNNRDVAIWDSSLISGDSDIDEFSSPVKNFEKINTLKEPRISEKSKQETVTTGSPLDLETVNEKIDFDFDDTDDLIEESPVKTLETQSSNLARFSKVLRDNFSYNPGNPNSNLSRKPLAKVDINIKSTSLKSENKGQRKINKVSNTQLSNNSTQLSSGLQENMLFKETTKNEFIKLSLKEQSNSRKQKVTLRSFAFSG